ncbi:MAG: nitrite reductase (NADH) large subunit, partial [Lentisphaeria bacterium]
MQETHQSQRYVWPWQLIYFLVCVRLFNNSGQENVNLWPSASIVCQCNNLSQGELVGVIAEGNGSLAALQSRTRAVTVCGSCKPLLAQLVGEGVAVEKQKFWKTSLIISLLALLAVVTMSIFPALSEADSVQTKTLLEHIWASKFWKQVTGFTVLGMTLVGLLMSLRKRINADFLGPFSYWRL